MLLAVLTLLGERGRAATVGEEAGVAAPALPAARRDVASRRGARGRPAPHRRGHVTAVPSGTGTTRSSPPAPWRLPPWPCLPDPARRWGWSRNAEQRRDVAVGRDGHVAAIAAVAAVGPALRDVRLASKGDRARAAVTAAQVALHLVDERGHETAYGGKRSRTRFRGRQQRSERSDMRRRVPRRRGERRHQAGDDVDELAAAATAELHHAVGGGEQGVVTAAADVLAGVELRAALADDDRAGADRGSRVHLHAESLRGGVAAVAGGRGTLLLRHDTLPSSSPGVIAVISITDYAWRWPHRRRWFDFGL